MHSRIRYLFSIIICVALGLGSRKFPGLLPHIISEHAGDMLWAMMVYFWFRFIVPYKSLLWAAGCSAVFSFAIEFSQLYQGEWIMELRDTAMGALILGRGFLTVDLIRYFMGIAIAAGADYFWLKWNKSGK